MKKLTTLFLIMIMAVSLFGCNSTSKCFTGEWKFFSIEKVELQPDLGQSMIDLLKEQYNAEDEDGIVSGALDSFTSEGSFNSFYLKFVSKNVYTYDVLMEREATWIFYLISGTEGFISFDADLGDSNCNPYPTVYPSLAYDVGTNTMLITMNYSSFMVTLKLVR